MKRVEFMYTQDIPNRRLVLQSRGSTVCKHYDSRLFTNEMRNLENMRRHIRSQGLCKRNSIKSASSNRVESNGHYEIR